MMKVAVVLAALTTIAEAADCNAMMIDASGTCPAGYDMANSGEMHECSAVLCTTMDEWAQAHGVPSNEKVVGQGFGCGIQDWDGTGVTEVVCLPSGESPPPPDPTPLPSGPTPPPTPGDNDGGGGGDGGITGGGVFLIIFFVGGFVYFAAGAAYMFKVKGERGVNLVINKDFWIGLPGMMKDGAMFLKNKATGGGYQSV